MTHEHFVSNWLLVQSLVKQLFERYAGRTVMRSALVVFYEVIANYMFKKLISLSNTTRNSALVCSSNFKHSNSFKVCV